ncbi:MAG: response regulator transcription factor [Chryseolinea sp.]
MHELSCLVVDDEPIARDIILHYAAQLPYLKVVGSCGNAINAKQMLQDHNVDVIFLDIQMPVIDGMRFLSTLKNPPQVIFTTAYREHAAAAFDLEACDYLVKPFSLERFIVAIDRAMEKLYPPKERSKKNIVATLKNKYLFVKNEGKVFKIDFENILYVEASGNNIRIVTNDQVIVPSMTLSSIESLLPGYLFIKTHRSFIINLSKITHIEGNRIYILKSVIPLGASHREGFFRQIGMPGKL